MDNPPSADQNIYSQKNTIVIDSDEEVLPEIHSSDMALADGITTIPQSRTRQEWQNAPSNPAFNFGGFLENARTDSPRMQPKQGKHVIPSPADFVVDSGSDLFAYSDDEADLPAPPSHPPNHYQSHRLMYPVFGSEKKSSSDDITQEASDATKGTYGVGVPPKRTAQNPELANEGGTGAVDSPQTVVGTSKTVDNGNESRQGGEMGQ